MADKEDGKQTEVVNTEPLVCALGGESSGGGENDGHETGGNGQCLLGEGVEGSLLGNEGCE